MVQVLTADEVDVMLDDLDEMASEFDGQFKNGHFLRVEWYQPGDSETPLSIVECDENGLLVRIHARLATADEVRVWFDMHGANVAAGVVSGGDNIFVKTKNRSYEVQGSGEQVMWFAGLAYGAAERGDLNRARDMLQSAHNAAAAAMRDLTEAIGLIDEKLKG